MQIKMLLFSFPSAQVARHSQGTTFLRHIQENTRQFIILSGLIWTQVDRSGQRLRQLSYLCTVFKTHREYWQRLGIEKGPFSALGLHNTCTVNPERQADGARFTPQRRRISRSAEQQKTDPDPLPRG